MLTTNEQVAYLKAMVSTPGPQQAAAMHTLAVRNRIREEQAATIRGRIQITDSEIAALDDSLLARMAKGLGWIDSARHPASTAGSRMHSGIVTNDVPFLPRPRALISRAEREALENPQPETIGLMRPQVLVNKRDRR